MLMTNQRASSEKKQYEKSVCFNATTSLGFKPIRLVHLNPMRVLCFNQWKDKTVFTEVKKEHSLIIFGFKNLHRSIFLGIMLGMGKRGRPKYSSISNAGRF